MKRSVMSKILTSIKKLLWKQRRRRRRSASASGGGSSFLPEEMVFDILVKLPEKSLLRFKCLSTGILNLMQSSHFVAAHVEHLRKNGKGIFLLAYRDVADNSTSRTGGCSFSLPFLKNPNLEHPRLEYVGSSNGLVCFNIFKDEKRFGTTSINMVVWNPATSNFRFAPPQPPLISSLAMVRYGFGYDSLSDDYKSVRLSVCVRAGVSAHVLSWGKMSWTKLTYEKHSCFDRRIFAIEPDAVTSKGRANWMVNPTSDSAKFVSFKLGEDEFELIYPPLKDYNGKKKTVCVWKGSLAMLIQNGTSPDTTLSLWLFNDDDDDDRDRWSKLFTVQTDYPCKWMSEPEYIWRTDVANSFLVYELDDRLALASMAGELRSRFGYRIGKGFEFAATSIPIPGSSLGT